MATGYPSSLLDEKWIKHVVSTIYIPSTEIWLSMKSQQQPYKEIVLAIIVNYDTKDTAT